MDSRPKPRMRDRRVLNVARMSNCGGNGGGGGGRTNDKYDDRHARDGTKENRKGESSRPGKRPLRALSACEKMGAIQRVHDGESKASVARDIGVPESTLRGWCKSEEKIRGMARNSSTPDSEAHSPASSSGANNAHTSNLASVSSNLSNLSSEDEGTAAKKPKLEQSAAATSAGTSSFAANDAANCDVGDTGRDAKPKIDYVALMTSMAGMRPENSSLLLHQLSLLSGTTGTLAKNLLSMASMPHNNTVGLVENGLQYTRNSAFVNGAVNMSNRRQSSLAVAPTQMNAVVSSPCTTRSLPATEAPCTPSPNSPRKTHEHHHHQQQHHHHPQQRMYKSKKEHANASTSSCSSTSSTSSSRKTDEALWMWLTQQQQMNPQTANMSPMLNHHEGSWFWQWYKHLGFPQLLSAPITPITSTPIARSSPGGLAQVTLDNALINNNNDNADNKPNLDLDGLDGDLSDMPASIEEAIVHGEMFLKWLDSCSEPAVTRLNVIQFRYLLDNLKECTIRRSSYKQSRK